MSIERFQHDATKLLSAELVKVLNFEEDSQKEPWLYDVFSGLEIDSIENKIQMALECKFQRGVGWKYLFENL